jgi:hypothetical protein
MPARSFRFSNFPISKLIGTRPGIGAFRREKQRVEGKIRWRRLQSCKNNAVNNISSSSLGNYSPPHAQSQQTDPFLRFSGSFCSPSDSPSFAERVELGPKRRPNRSFFAKGVSNYLAGIFMNRYYMMESRLNDNRSNDIFILLERYSQ